MAESNGDRKKDDQGPGHPDRGTGAGRSGRRPMLTERQRREAREVRRRKKGGRPSRSRRKTGNPLTNGIRATGRELTRAFAFLGGLTLSGLDALSPVGRAFTEALGQVARAIEWLIEKVARALAATGRLIARAIGHANRILTPARALVIVAFASALLLGWSQFIDYRAVEIGQPGYAKVLDVATPPTTDGRTPIDEHSFLLVAAALAALAGTALAARGRRPAALLVSATGLLALAVGLLIDLPAGTDASKIASAYAGAEPVLLAGFWLEIAAGAGLAFCGAMLATAPRPAVRRTRSRQSRRPVAARGTG